MKPDVIISQPDNTDFPAWRDFIYQNRDHFNQVIVCICKANASPNLTNFLREELTSHNIFVINQPNIGSGESWYSKSVRESLRHAKSARILFLEQDFIIWNKDFLPTVLANKAPLIGFKDVYTRNDRLHPAFLLVDKAILEKTSMDFSVQNGLDHFGQFSRELEALVPTVSLEEIGFKRDVDWEHLAGLTSNYYLVVSGGKPNHNPDRFVEYNKQLLDLPVTQCAEFFPYIKKAANHEF